MKIIDEKNLAYKAGTSDKVYHFQLVEVDGGFKVNFQNGKRGGTLTNRTKHPEPVTLQEAQATFTDLLKSKLKDGYSEGCSGAVYMSDGFEERFTGIIGQMLNKVTDATKYIESEEYFMQEKFDGERRLIKITDGTVLSINKKGLEVPTLESVAQPLLALGKNLLVDGELVGETYHIFDLVEFDGKDMRSAPAEQRHAELIQLKLPNTAPIFTLVETKRRMYEQMKKERLEGVVFKKKNSLYVSGRPNSGGDQLKFKFYATDTFEVVAHTQGKRSVNIVSYTEDGKAYDMGKVTIPENAQIPAIGSFIEVRYLYCHVNGRLFQTTFLKERTDQDRSDCHMREIKFKATQEEDD